MDREGAVINFFFLLGCNAARPGGQNIARFCDKAFEDKLQKARQSTDTEERAKSAQALGFLRKPFLPSQVFNTIERVLQRSGT